MIGKDILQRILKGKIVIVGVGNILRGDDGLGSVFVELLKSKVPVPCINAGNALENHLGLILREQPDTILLVDAVHLNLNPGDARIVDPGRIEHAGLSTHDLSPGLFLDFLVEESKCDVFLLGIQPQQIEMGKMISAAVQETLEILVRELVAVLGSADHILQDPKTADPVAAFGPQ